jgi:hypothetical protein
MSKLAQVAAEVSEAVAPVSTQVKRSRLASLAAEVNATLVRKAAAVDRDAEWQRVHSYIADVLKDTHVLYAKLARLEGDFGGEELTRLERVSEAVLQLGNELSGFSKAFYEGKYDMAQSDFAYGEKHNKGPDGDAGKGDAPPPPPPDAEALGDLEQAGEDEGAAAALLEGQGEGQEQEQAAQ